MFGGNLAFFIFAAALIVLLRFRAPSAISISDPDREFAEWDWIFLAGFFVTATWMMFGTLSMGGGNLLIGNHQWSDFGSNVSIMQSFAVGNNFPTEYPHFSGDRIRYHFLFYFLAGNLEYLGLDPAAANNIISILTLLAMVVLVMTLGSVLFASRAAGRIGALLFFVHGSLAYVPFLAGTNSFSDAISKIWEQKGFLTSGLPYRGEDWGVWSQVVYLNQRHLASSIGLLLVVLIFLVMRYQERAKRLANVESDLVIDPEAAIVDDGPDDNAVAAESKSDSVVDADPSMTVEGHAESTITLEETKRDSVTDRDSVITVEGHVESRVVTDESRLGIIERYAGFALAGCLLGLMPMWNGAVFAGAAAVLAVLFILLPLRKEMIVMAVTTGVLALPQVMYLKMGAKPASYSLFHWGYTISDPGFGSIGYYLIFTFGFKWLLIIAALVWGTGLQRKIMAGLMSLFVLTFCFQFSDEVLANHKFLNIWLVVANIFAGFGLVRLWQMKLGPSRTPTRALAVALMLLISIGGVIDLIVIKNIYWVQAKFEGDKLVEWVRHNTDQRAVFLSHRHVNHGILMAGRRLFYGHPYYAWGAGYPVAERDRIFKKIFESRNAAEVYSLIKENGISYVAIDDALRRSDFIRGVNETLFERLFPVVFEDTEKQYDNLKIYLVPPDLEIPADGGMDLSAAEVKATANALEGGEGTGGGQFSKPRGINTDSKGNFYVADTGNGRIQKFSPDGMFLLSIGTPGSGIGQLGEPNGVAVDMNGRIYAVDAANHKLIRFDSAGNFEKEWKGPDPGFYGPRDLALGPNQQLYIVDQGRTRVVRFDPATESFFSWGTAGAGPGQFLESTGIGIGGGQVFICDLGNNRIQVFDLQGNIIRMWEIPEWGKYPWHYPDAALDERGQRLYVTNGWKNELLAFDLEGNRADPRLERTPVLANPSSLVTVDNGGLRRLLVLNTEGRRVEAVRLPPLTAR